MKTILFVMPRLPFPTTSGRKNSLYHYCRIIHSLGYRLVIAAFLEDGDNTDNKPDFIDRLVVLPNVSSKEKVINLIKNSFMKNGKPMQVSLFWSKNAKKIIDDLIVEENPVAVISDMVRTTEYIKDACCFKIADLDDMISLRYQRQLENDIEGINPYGAYLYNLPKFIQKILLNRKVKVAIVKHEINLLKRYEVQIGEKFDKTVFVAESEAKKLNSLLKSKNKAIAVPIGVDIEYFSKRVELLNDGISYISFLGQMNVSHNENAAIYFIKEILPLINKKLPNVKFLIIGGGVTAKLKSYACNNVIITGRVSDVRKYIQSSRVFVCPLMFGSGIKTKNLEAMASGIPVVTTSIGAENIDAKHERDWIISDIKEEMADEIIKLLQDKSYCENIGVNGQKFIESHFTWQIAFEQWDRILKVCGEL